MTTLSEIGPCLRQHIAWRDPNAEVAGIVRLVWRQLNLDKDMPYGAVYIAVPNKLRMVAIKEALAHERITSFSPRQLEELRTSGDLLTATVDFGGAVCLGSYGSIARMAPQHLFCVSLVTGMYPVGNEDEKTLKAEAMVLKCALEDVPGTVVFSSFKRAAPEEAETLRLPVTRCRREHDKQVVCIAASPFIAELDDNGPALVSGEQYLTMIFS